MLGPDKSSTFVTGNASNIGMPAADGNPNKTSGDFASQSAMNRSETPLKNQRLNKDSFVLLDNAKDGTEKIHQKEQARFVEQISNTTPASQVGKDRNGSEAAVVI